MRFISDDRNSMTWMYNIMCIQKNIRYNVIVCYTSYFFLLLLLFARITCSIMRCDPTAERWSRLVDVIFKRNNNFSFCFLFFFVKRKRKTCITTSFELKDSASAAAARNSSYPFRAATLRTGYVYTILLLFCILSRTRRRYRSRTRSLSSHVSIDSKLLTRRLVPFRRG